MKIIINLIIKAEKASYDLSVPNRGFPCKPNSTLLVIISGHDFLKIQITVYNDYIKITFNNKFDKL